MPKIPTFPENPADLLAKGDSRDHVDALIKLHQETPHTPPMNSILPADLPHHGQGSMSRDSQLKWLIGGIFGIIFFWIITGIGIAWCIKSANKERNRGQRLHYAVDGTVLGLRSGDVEYNGDRGAAAPPYSVAVGSIPHTSGERSIMVITEPEKSYDGRPKIPGL